MTHPRSIWNRNGLSGVLAIFFVAFLGGQVWSGYVVDHSHRLEEQLPPLALSAYLRSGHFLSTTFENWESEFLQMATYVLLTVVLRQAGSAESRPFSTKPRKTRA